MRNILIILFVLTSFVAFPQEKRLAIVIGNSAYENGGVLKNPVNDAYAMKDGLAQAGFEVVEYFNLDQGEMKRAIDDFGLRLKNYDVGLFYYAGHGIQVNGQNYLIPVDANLNSENDVEYDCIDAGRVLGKMENAKNSTNIIILDACRNNPFERSWSRSTSGNGLAFMDAPTGTLIAYATAPGHTASDGVGIHGLYTSAILKSMQIPDITILEMFQNVRSFVTQQSNDQQVPWETTSLIGNFYFNRDIKMEISRIDTLTYGGDFNMHKDLEASESSETNGYFIDARDDNTYIWIKIGEQIWMSENLNYTTSDGSWCYKNKDSNCDVYGRLYNWKTAQKVCPSGWHLPSDKDFYQLNEYVSAEFGDTLRFGSHRSGRVLRARSGKWKKSKMESNNATGFSALPGGSFEENRFTKKGEFAMFWSSSTRGAATAFGFGVDAKSNYFYILKSPADHGMSVRCIKD